MHTNARRLSRALYWIFLAGMVLAPLAASLISLNLDWALKHAGQGLSFGFDLNVRPENVGPIFWDVQLLALAAMAVPTAMIGYVFWNLARLFGNYARDAVFTDENTRRIRRVGILLLIRELLSPLEGAALSVILTMHNPPGQHLLNVSVEDSNLTMIVTALTIIVAAHVMAQAREIQAEAELTI
ncbi:DUF2975 domain-containing protein [Pseudodesulfovibrio sp.]|uniref:DUF2975 domain-containing protein n=1 Tax=unclassified Pseudodesulfovibrio TaxID=2661612 RepID=UPI003AFF6289